MIDDQLLAKAMALNKAGHLEEAVELLNFIIAATDDPAEKAVITLDRSSYYSAHGNLLRARKDLEIGRSLAPNDPLTCIMYEFGDACLSGQEGHQEKYFEKLNKIVVNWPQLPTEPNLRFLYEDIRILLGIELSRLGQSHDAILLLRESLSYQLSPEERSNVLCHLGACYENTLDHELAIEQLDEALMLGVSNEWAVAVHSYLGICYHHLRRFAESKEQFLLCEKDGGGPGVPLSNIYGWLLIVCAALGQRAESEKYAVLSKPL